MRSLRPMTLALLSVVACLALLASLAAARTGADSGSRGGDEGVPAGASATTGRELFETSCASCHGADGSGTANGPTLIGVGAAAADFQLSTGRMPFAGPAGSQAKRKPPAFDPQQIDDLVAFVASLGEGPAIPQVSTDRALLSRGQQVFIDNCAPCHGSSGRGGAVGSGSFAPALDQATPRQVGEALLTRPGQMPVFALPSTDVDAVATYVEYLQSAPQPGGFAIGGVGGVPEGFVAWFLGLGLLIGIVYLIGREWDRTTEVPE